MTTNQRLASFISANVQTDSAKQWPGTPPNFGQPVVDHVFTVSGQFGVSGQAYLNADEAIMHDPSNSERMKADCAVTEPLEGRQRTVSLLKWHIEAEDDDSADAKELSKIMTRILKRTKRFVELRRNTQEAIWTGRTGIATQFRSVEVGNDRRIICSRWEPRHGDKLVFRYDSGTREYDPDQVGIRVSSASMPNFWSARDQIQPTVQGMVYWLNASERQLLIVHKHMIEDGPFEKPQLAGRIHGVGIRSRIYWTWYAMVECMQRALEYLDRAAFGVELWKYPANNPAAKKKVEEAAAKYIGGGRTVVMIPVYPGEQSNLYGVEHIEPGLAGVDRILQVIKECFQLRIKRYILGQTLTSEVEAQGMGNGAADAHLATFADIIAYDARNQEETLTDDLVRPLQLWNFPSSRKYYLRFVIDTESDNIKEKLESLKSGWDMGMPIRTADIASAIGVSVPQENEDQVFNPQIHGAIQQSRQQPMSEPIDPSMNAHKQIMAHSLQKSLNVPQSLTNAQ